MFLLAAGAVLFARAPIPNDFISDILPGSVLMAIGRPATFVNVNIAALTAVEQADSGLASGLMNTAHRQRQWHRRAGRGVARASWRVWRPD